MDADEITNPRKTLQRRMNAEGLNAGEAGPVWDKSFSKPVMTQTEFAKAIPRRQPTVPPADLLKKHYKE